MPHWISILLRSIYENEAKSRIKGLWVSPQLEAETMSESAVDNVFSIIEKKRAACV